MVTCYFILDKSLLYKKYKALWVLPLVRQNRRWPDKMFSLWSKMLCYPTQFGSLQSTAHQIELTQYFIQGKALVGNAHSE
jgi:hypothetical protein